MKVVFFCQADYAGSAYQAVKAINSVGEIEARHIVCHKHPWGFEADVVLPSIAENRRVEDCLYYEEACDLMADADLIHTWNDEYFAFFGPRTNMTKAFYGDFPRYEKAKSCTFTGSWYRRWWKDINARLNEAGTKLVVQTPAFVMEEMKSTFIPHAIEVENFVPLPMAERWDVIGCYHHGQTTANRDIKILESILSKTYPSWRLALEKTGRNAHRLINLARCKFFMQDLDDRMISYGRSTIEALALGVPVINRVHPALSSFMDDIPIIHATPETLEDAVAEAMGQDYDVLAKKSRAWVERYHSYKVIGEKYTKFFTEVV